MEGAAAMFDRFPEPAGDALHAVMARCRADPRRDKLDLGVGVYRDETGASPIMDAVREAEQALAGEGDTKAYQALAGDHDFIAAMSDLILGGLATDQIAAIQGTGGTGALRIALDLARVAMPNARLHLGLPSWPNHEALGRAVGMAVVPHRYFDPVSQSVDLVAIESAARGTKAGDLFLLQGSCHNPTGVDLPSDFRAHLLGMLAAHGAVPLIDAAYYGLGEGLAADLAALRDDLARCPRALLAVACSKSFGLYRERTGILFALTADSAERARVQGQMEKTSRTLVSMPPAHGAGVVARILGDPHLRRLWEDELAAMRSRMLGLRVELAALGAPLLAGIDRQRGIFRLASLDAAQVDRLGAEHAIHMAPSGRINLAGLKPGDGPRLAAALEAVS